MDSLREAFAQLDAACDRTDIPAEGEDRSERANQPVEVAAEPAFVMPETRILVDEKLPARYRYSRYRSDELKRRKFEALAR